MYDTSLNTPKFARFSRATAAWQGQFHHRLGRFGEPFHVILACVCVLAAFGPTFAVETFWLLLAGCWILRLPFVWRGVGAVIGSPTWWALAAWVLWTLVTLAWSPDIAAGKHELSYARWLLIPIAIWPVLHQRKLLIACLVLGALLAHGVQVYEWFVVHGGGVSPAGHPPALDPSARLSGWWFQPAIGGAMCAVSAGLHWGPALFGAGRWRWIGIAGVVSGITGALIAGSRGGLLAALLTGSCVFAVGLLSAPKGSRWKLVGRAGLLVIASKLALSLVLLALPVTRARIDAGYREAYAALRGGDYASDTGMRVFVAQAAARVWAGAPIVGVGAGGLQTSVERIVSEAKEVPPERTHVLRTAHNAYLHAGATTGVVGVILLASTLILALRAGLAWAATAAPGKHPFATYAGAPVGGLLALACAGVFETVQFNASTAFVGTVLLALCPGAIFDTRTRSAP